MKSVTLIAQKTPFCSTQVETVLEGLPLQKAMAQQGISPFSPHHPGHIMVPVVQPQQVEPPDETATLIFRDAAKPYSQNIWDAYTRASEIRELHDRDPQNIPAAMPSIPTIPAAMPSNVVFMDH